MKNISEQGTLTARALVAGLSVLLGTGAGCAATGPAEQVDDGVAVQAVEQDSQALDEGAGAKGAGLPPASPPKGVPTSTISDAPSGATTAAQSCWFSGSHWWCNNRVPSPIFESGTGRQIDNLRTNPSWFVCRAEAGFSGGGPHPTRWVWTQGDDVGAWGWVRDIDIASETNSLPSC